MGLFDWSDPRVMTSDELLRIDQRAGEPGDRRRRRDRLRVRQRVRRLGTEVTVVEMLDQLLPGEDKRVGRTLQQAFKKAGIAVHVKTAVEAAEAGRRRRDAAPRRRRRGHGRARARRRRAAARRAPASATRRPAWRSTPAASWSPTRAAAPTLDGVFAAGRRRRPAAPRPLGLSPGRDRRRERRDRLRPALRPHAHPQLRRSARPRSPAAALTEDMAQGGGRRARGRARALQRQLQGGLRRRRRRASCASSASRAAGACSAPAWSGRTSPSSCTSSPWRSTPA